MIAQGVKDFVHLEDGRQGFNQQRGFDGAARQIEAVLCLGVASPTG
jgi:hypothetical protein